MARKVKRVSKTPEQRIAYHIEQMRACESSFVEHAVKAGDVLIEQKGVLGHGEYLAWLDENWTRTRRTASDYILLASFEDRDALFRAESITQAKQYVKDNRQLEPEESNGKRVSHLEETETVKHEVSEESTVLQGELLDAEPVQDEPLKIPKPGSELPSPAKLVDTFYKAHYPPMVRGLDATAEAIGSKGHNYKTANDALNMFSHSIKKMREGQA